MIVRIPWNYAFRLITMMGESQIPAIKALRESSNKMIGLKQYKDIVENLRDGRFTIECPYGNLYYAVMAINATDITLRG